MKGLELMRFADYKSDNPYFMRYIAVFYSNQIGVTLVMTDTPPLNEVAKWLNCPIFSCILLNFVAWGGDC